MTTTTKQPPKFTRPKKYDAHIIAVLETFGSPVTSGVVASGVSDRMAQLITPPPYVSVATMTHVLNRMYAEGAIERHTARGSSLMAGVQVVIESREGGGRNTMSIDIAKLRELEARATRGPFKMDHDRRDGGVDQIVETGPRELTIAFGTSNGNEDDLPLLVELRNALPALLARLEAAEACVEAMHRWLDADKTIRAAEWETLDKALAAHAAVRGEAP